MDGSQNQGFLPSAPRARAALLIAAIGVAVLIVGLIRAQSEAIGKSQNQKVTICHATGSATNPYVEITVNTNAANGEKLNDHTHHDDDIIPAPAGGCPTNVPPPGGPDHKVDVCHVTSSASNPVVLINISQSALQHHLDHGDYLADPVKGCVKGTTTPPDDPDDPGKPNNPNNPKTPVGNTVVVTETAASVQGAAPSKAARVCTSRRSFRIRIRSKRRDPVVRATVSVNGKRVKTLRGKRITAPVVLRGLPKGQFSVRITATTRKGRKLTGTRKYRTCTPKSKRQSIPLL